MAPSPHTDGIRFGAFEIDLRSRELRKSGIRVKLQDLPFRLLVFLAERPGELVTREALGAALWPAGTFVDFEHGLGTAINKVREALGDSAANPRFIETIPRRGYRFLATVESVGAALAAPIKQRPRLGWGGILVVGLALAIAVFAIGWAGRLGKSGGTASFGPIRSLAVLPLENLSGDASQDYFADGITEELTTDLAKIGALRVISHTSVERFKHAGKSLPDIARLLHVDAVVEGAVLRSGNQVRITAQLVRAPAYEHLWAQTYDRDLGDVLAFEDEVAREIAGEIRIQLSALERSRLATARKVIPEVHDAYLKGRDEWSKRNPASLVKALESFKAAIGKDSTYAPGYAGLADTYAILGAAGYDVMPESEAMEEARAAALKAIELDDTLSDAHASLGFVAYSYDWNWAEAEKEFKRSLDLNPSNATAHQWYSEFLADLSRWQPAIAESERAAAVDPMSPIIHENLARPYYYSRRLERAIAYSKQTLEGDPDFSISHLRLGRAYAAEGRYTEAAAEFQRYFTLSGGSTLALASLANVRARAGERQEALRLAAQLRSEATRKNVPAYQFALIYAGLDDSGEAIRWLEKAYQERSDFLVCLKVEPLFDGLRADPRFQAIERRIGLEP